MCARTCDKNSTLGSVVPLAMFYFLFSDCPWGFVWGHSFVFWLDWKSLSLILCHLEKRIWVSFALEHVFYLLIKFLLSRCGFCLRSWRNKTGEERGPLRLEAESFLRFQEPWFSFASVLLFFSVIVHLTFSLEIILIHNRVLNWRKTLYKFISKFIHSEWESAVHSQSNNTALHWPKSHLRFRKREILSHWCEDRIFHV